MLMLHCYYLWCCFVFFIIVIVAYYFDLLLLSLNHHFIQQQQRLLLCYHISSKTRCGEDRTRYAHNNMILRTQARTIQDLRFKSMHQFRVVQCCCFAYVFARHTTSKRLREKCSRFPLMSQVPISVVL